MGSGGTGGSGVGSGGNAGDIDAGAGGSGAGPTSGGSGGTGSTGGGGSDVSTGGTDGGQATGGTGGDSGSGGTSGTGGSETGGAAGTGGGSGNAGTSAAGGAGNAGASGASGASTGGAAGNSGAAGTGGTAGNDGGAGKGGSSGTSGAGGATDGGGTAPGAVFAVGSFVKSSATGGQTVSHSLGQTPKALLLWTVAKTNETASADVLYGIGVTDGSTQMSTAMGIQDDAQQSSSSRRIARKAITLVRWSENTVAEADLSSWNSGSFALNWTTNDSQPYVVHYLAIGGPQVTAKVVTWTAPTSAGQRQVTGTGFRPEAVLHFYAGAAFTNNPPDSLVNGVTGMGMMDRAGGQCAFQVADVDNSDPSDTSRAQRVNAAVYTYVDGSSQSVSKDASFVSMDNNGFTLDFTTANSSASEMFSLALGGLRAKVGNFNKSTSTGVPVSQPITSPGFRPGTVLFSSVQSVANTSGPSHSSCRLGIGASDGTTDGSSAIMAADNDSPTDTEALDKTSKVFVKVDNTGGTIDAEADLASFDPNGFTLSWTRNDSVATQVCFLALGAP